MNRTTVYLAFPRDDSHLRALVEAHKASFDASGYGFAYAYSHGAFGTQPRLVLDLPEGVDPTSLIPGLEFSVVALKAEETPAPAVSEPEQQKEEDDGTTWTEAGDVTR